MPTYIVKHTLKYKGKEYKPGSQIEFDENTAERVVGSITNLPIKESKGDVGNTSPNKSKKTKENK